MIFVFEGQPSLNLSWTWVFNVPLPTIARLGMAATKRTWHGTELMETNSCHCNDRNCGYGDAVMGTCEAFVGMLYYLRRTTAANLC